MNELVTLVRKKLKGKEHVGMRIPNWMGIILGYLADGFSKVTGKRLAVSSIRIKKFVSNSQFSSSKNIINSYKPPFEISEGIVRTLESEFIFPDPSREIFFSE